MGLVTVNTGSCPGLLTPTAVMKHLDAWPLLRNFFKVLQYHPCIYAHMLQIHSSNFTTHASQLIGKCNPINTWQHRLS